MVDPEVAGRFAVTETPRSRSAAAQPARGAQAGERRPRSATVSIRPAVLQADARRDRSRETGAVERNRGRRVLRMAGGRRAKPEARPLGGGRQPIARQRVGSALTAPCRSFSDPVARSAAGGARIEGGSRCGRGWRSGPGTQVRALGLQRRVRCDDAERGGVLRHDVPDGHGRPVRRLEPPVEPTILAIHVVAGPVAIALLSLSLRSDGLPKIWQASAVNRRSGLEASAVFVVLVGSG